MRILFAGDLSAGGRTLQRRNALTGLGHEVDSVPYYKDDSGLDRREAFWEKVCWKLRLPLDPAGANDSIRLAAEKNKFDAVWIDKGNIIRPSTLMHIRQALPDAKIISCSEDDMYARHNRTVWYTKSLPYYDIVFTTKVYNLEELKELGAKRTALFLDAYDPDLHKPRELSHKERMRFGCDVGFIGTFEEDRAEKMLYLAENGIRVVVWGNGWENWRGVHANLEIKNEPIYGEDFVRAINATRINLGFLRKMNRDEVTSRSVEIPASGGFLLAERTKRHLEFFKEGKEAEFFGSKEELLAKTLYYLTHEEERLRIASAGRIRCINSGYDQGSQLNGMLKKVGAIINK